MTPCPLRLPQSPQPSHLVSCSGIRQICHGDRETEWEKHNGEGWVDGGLVVMKSCFWATALWDFSKEAFQAFVHLKSVVLSYFGFSLLSCNPFSLLYILKVIAFT